MNRKIPFLLVLSTLLSLLTVAPSPVLAQGTFNWSLICNNGYDVDWSWIGNGVTITSETHYCSEGSGTGTPPLGADSLRVTVRSFCDAKMVTKAFDPAKPLTVNFSVSGSCTAYRCKEGLCVPYKIKSSTAFSLNYSP